MRVAFKVRENQFHGRPLQKRRDQLRRTAHCGQNEARRKSATGYPVAQPIASPRSRLRHGPHGPAQSVGGFLVGQPFEITRHER